LDIHDISAPIALNLKSEDTSRRLIATLMEKGQPYEITDDCSAKLVMELPDNGFAVGVCLIEGNQIIYDIDESVTAKAGTVKCEFMLKDATGHRITCPRFNMIISPIIDEGRDVG
jgi:hypothetical protein